MSKALPDFSQISFLPVGQRTEPGGKTDLLRFFNAVIEHEKLEVDQVQLEHIFCQDLTIDTKKLDRRLVCVLAEALIYYMAVWPGWQRGAEYYSGQLPCKEWFERFRQYLIFKSNFIIKNAPKFAAESNSEVTTKDVAVQTQITEIDKSGQKKSAPYTLCVGGPPSVLNNIVFMESNGNILIKQHMEKQWRDIKPNEFINWPHMSVEVNLPDITITRTNSHKFERYIALCGDLTPHPDVNHISFIQKTSADANMQPYTYDFIFTYLQKLCQTLKLVTGIQAKRLQELDAIFTEFLADIKEVNVYNCTMATGISVGFHIGKCKYIRNKKMVSSDPKRKSTEENTINFYEILIPQVDFSFHQFKAVQDALDQANVSFTSLNRILKLLKGDGKHPDLDNLRKIINETCIIYRCTLCNESFNDTNAYFKLTSHFSTHHKAEQALLCFSCRKEFTVQYLTGQRWKHTCSENKKTS